MCVLAEHGMRLGKQGGPFDATGNEAFPELCMAVGIGIEQRDRIAGPPFFKQGFGMVDRIVEINDSGLVATLVRSRSSNISCDCPLCPARCRVCA